MDKLKETAAWVNDIVDHAIDSERRECRRRKCGNFQQSGNCRKVHKR